MKLTVVIGTRGRPDKLVASLETTLSNVSRKNTTILVAMDADDTATIRAIKDIPRGVHLSIKPREATRGLKYDRALTEAPADLYLVGHDCTPIVTPDFDAIICEAGERFPDGIGCVCSPMVNASFPAFQAPTAKMVELMGYIYPHYFPFWFVDHWLDDIARMTDRYAMVDVHQDCTPRDNVGKTIGLRDVAFWASYYDALIFERREQANRIIDALDEPEWRKATLRGNFPMIEYRSRWVNDIVRQSADAIEDSRGNDDAPPEYLRVKEEAIERLRRMC